MDAFPSGRRPWSRPRTFASSPETDIDKIEHVQHHRDCGGADTQATHLLRRDGTQPAPNSRRNVSEGGVPGVLPRPDQPGSTSSSLLTIHPERNSDGKRHPKPANWAPAEEPEEVPDATTGAPGHRVVPTTPCGNFEAQEVTVLAQKDVSNRSAQFEVQSAAAVEPPSNKISRSIRFSMRMHADSA